MGAVYTCLCARLRVHVCAEVGQTVVCFGMALCRGSLCFACSAYLNSLRRSASYALRWISLRRHVHAEHHFLRWCSFCVLCSLDSSAKSVQSVPTARIFQYTYGCATVHCISSCWIPHRPDPSNSCQLPTHPLLIWSGRSRHVADDTPRINTRTSRPSRCAEQITLIHILAAFLLGIRYHDD